MVKKNIKNWDNKTWLSSKRYIQTFNNFLLRQIELNRNSQILDIGCGRGKILGSLSLILRLKNKPTGIDIERHKDKDKKIIFKKIDAIKYFKKNKKKFDLILIKQTIHLLKFKEIKQLLFLCNEALNPKGKIIIFSLNTNQNEIPTFSLMKKKLKNSLNRDKQIIQFILNLDFKILIKKFVFKVKITRKKYIQMIRNRYISTLLNFKSKEINEGINEISTKYRKNLRFNDKLICLILKK
jgi:cyclopropane fatty-acyl-phospholipid synthase-like methyltransferase|tara:strand:+ start:1402 stop:2118 length:717 start_codon:yes stop_codon:yes gene_type:complete